MNQQQQRDGLVQFDTPQRNNSCQHPSWRRISCNARLVATVMLSVGLTLIGPKLAHAQLDIFDDFEDFEDRDDYQHVIHLKTDWTINSPGGKGAIIKSGDLIRQPAAYGSIPDEELEFGVSYLEFAESKLTDVSIRTQARLLKEFGEPEDWGWHSISLAARLCGPLGNHCKSSPDEFTYFDVWSTGEVRAQQSEAAAQRIEHTDLRPLEEDVVLQVDAFGEDIKYWVWRYGEPRPEEPIIQYTWEDEPVIDEGGALFGVIGGQAAFRNVYISETPIEDALGDFSFDFQVDAADIDMLSTEILSESPRLWFDLNGDDEVTDADRAVWVGSEDIANTFFGDADLNGEVDFGDFLALSDNFGQHGGWAKGDFDGLGDVQFSDFLLLSSNFGNVREATLAQSVPEPNASLLALASCLCLCLRRTRLA